MRRLRASLPGYGTVWVTPIIRMVIGSGPSAVMMLAPAAFVPLPSGWFWMPAISIGSGGADTAATRRRAPSARVVAARIVGCRASALARSESSAASVPTAVVVGATLGAALAFDA